ncbi:MAG: DMT family transporter [Acidobacteriota bacterium]
MKDFKNFFADLGLLYSAAIWGSTFFMVKSALEFISPLALIGYRFLIASVFMYILLRFMKRPVFKNFKNGIMLGVILWFVYFPQTLGLKYTTASNSGFITGLFIVFVPFMGWMLFRKLPALNKILSVFIALSGLWILTGGMNNINRGDVLTLITALAYALHILFAGKYMGSGSDPFVLTFQQFFVVGVLSIISALPFSVSLSWTQGHVWWTIAFLAVFPTLSAFLIQMISQKFTSPVKVALIFSMEPVFAAIFAWTLGGELFVLRRGIGGLIIVSAILISELPVLNINKK